MDSNVARNLFARLIQNTEKPVSGPVSLSAEDATSLHKIVTEIIHRDNEGNRGYWGPRVGDMNDLCDIILTKEQLQNKGLRKDSDNFRRGFSGSED